MPGSRLRAVIRDEGGQALVLALGIVVISVLIGLGVVTFALNTKNQSTHDERTREAQQAADAGVQQQLYRQSDSAPGTYNLSGGLLGLNNLVDCVVPQVSASVVVGTVQVQANNGACPLSVSASCAAGSTCPSTNGVWTPLSDGDYYQSEFFPNEQQQTTGVGNSQSAYNVQFPEIVSIGCHTTATANQAASCNSGAGTNQYSKQLTVLQPHAPLQSIEAGHNVTISGLLGVTSIIEGNIVAGNNISLPLVNLGFNLGTSLSTLLGGLLGSLNLTGTLQQLQATFEYGNTISGYTVGANLVHTGTSSYCTAGQPSSSCLLVPAPFSINAQPTPTSSFGTTANSAVQFSQSCLLFICSGSYAYSGTTTTTGDLYANGGTLRFNTPGTYVFCNFYAKNTTIQGPTSGSVQIYVLPPNATSCLNDTTSASVIGSATQGNFYADQGISNLTSASLVEGVVSPSAFQIYVAGNPTDKTALQSNPNGTPTTAVNIATSSTNLSLAQSYTVDAPLSNVTIGNGSLSNLAFEGNAIGWNVGITAAVVLQDLDLGNYPLSVSANSYQVKQTVQCTVSTIPLTNTTSDLNGC